MARPSPPPNRLFPVVDDCLVVGGIPLPQLAQRVGSSPFYAYDRALLNQRVAELRQALPDAIALHYAIKANPMPAVVQHMAAIVDGLDVASGGELQVALDTGIDPSTVSFAGPAKQPWELSMAIAAGITLNLESERELARCAQLGEQLGIPPRVAVRVNPDFELKGAGMKMGGSPRPFGVDAERVPAMLKRIGDLELNFVGLHIYAGSQNLRVESLMEAQAKTLELGFRLADHAPGPLQTFNIGGGFGIPYFPGDAPLDLAPIGEHLAHWLPRVREHLGDTQLVLELGRYLVGEAGIYVAEVVDRKSSRGQVFLLTNGGLHHHLAASGNFGQVIRKNYPLVVGNRVVGSEREVVTVVGPLCTPLDILGDKIELARADVGDLIVVFQSGAYGATASPGGFLGHPAVTEVLV